MKELIKRRSFIKSATTAGIGLGLVPHTFPVFGKNAPNEKLVVAIMGLNGRGSALASEYAQQDGYEIAYICDVDDSAIAKGIEIVMQHQKKKPKAIKDFRKALEDKALDTLVIAAPDHWHAPATIIALQADKHVYVEKPCGHNPKEGEMLIEAQKRYGKVVQMGNQQRSAPESIQAIREIREGIIGTPYFAKAWYANARGPIGTGKKAPVPAGLDYELWQGPAPRIPYQDNLIHYNWHWFWNWGTGEICNNGTHEIDVCRWALDTNYPIRVSSQGGRYHYDDDWEFYDTQITSFDFEGEKTIIWEGRSCNGHPIEGRGRGSAIYGTEGTIILDRNGYVLYDKDNKVVKEVKPEVANATMDTVGGDSMTGEHIRNFGEVIRNGAEQNSPILEGHKSVLLCHLGNIAQEKGRTLEINPENGHIKNDAEAMQMWSREYEEGWTPSV